jgi:hypothetical protein
MSEPRATSTSFARAEPGPSADEALWLDCVGRAARETDPVVLVETLLPYLESFPLGAHNRATAERIELLLDRIEDGPTKRDLGARLRRARDPFLPPLFT